MIWNLIIAFSILTFEKYTSLIMNWPFYPRYNSKLIYKFEINKIISLKLDKYVCWDKYVILPFKFYNNKDKHVNYDLYWLYHEVYTDFPLFYFLQLI